MSSPVSVLLQVPYVENEQQFLIHVVEAAIKAFRSRNASLSEGLEKRSTQTPISTSAMDLPPRAGVET